MAKKSKYKSEEQSLSVISESISHTSGQRKK